jgi:hypothetical protein
MKIDEFAMDAETLTKQWCPKVIAIGVGNPSPRLVGLTYTPPYISLKLTEPSTADNNLTQLWRAQRFAIDAAPERYARLMKSGEPLSELLLEKENHAHHNSHEEDQA